MQDKLLLFTVRRHGEEYRLRVHRLYIEGNVWDRPSLSDLEDVIANTYIPLSPNESPTQVKIAINDLCPAIYTYISGAEGVTGVYDVTPRWFDNYQVWTHHAQRLEDVDALLQLRRQQPDDGYSVDTYWIVIVFATHPLRCDFVVIEMAIFPPYKSYDTSGDEEFRWVTDGRPGSEQ